MKHTPWLFAICFWVTLAPLRATEIQSRWSDLCRVSGGYHLKVSTADGKEIRGLCSGITGDDLFLSSKQGVSRVGRSTVTHIWRYRPGYFHHMRSLGEQVSGGFETGVVLLHLPFTPIGMVMIPAAVGWAAIATPVCLFRDILDNGSKMQQITISD